MNFPQRDRADRKELVSKMKVTIAMENDIAALMPSFEVEEAKAHLIQDLHRLSSLMGHDEAREWIKKNWVSLPF